MGGYVSWGKYCVEKHIAHEFYWQNELLPMIKNYSSILAVGMRRSYGDSCLNTNGEEISTKRFNRLIDFNVEQGILEACSGLALYEINDITIPAGWFIPVTPGTSNVTLGGMIANDVHGKNHHIAGSFGNHVISLKLLLSSGKVVSCSPAENIELFNATIGGLGLTGIILDCKVQLRKISSRVMYVEDIPFTNFTDFQYLSDQSDKSWEHTVAWLDGGSVKSGAVKGVFSRGNHSGNDVRHLGTIKPLPMNIPFMAPNILLNSVLMRGFNSLYYRMHRSRKNNYKTIESFFYPLDRLHNWNRLYGKRGFYQYQCVVPFENGLQTVREILELAKAKRLSPYLSVLKRFGDKLPVGMISFPMPGFTLAMDFPNTGNNVLSLFDMFDKLVLTSKGRIYPAKDARMSADTFNAMFPLIDTFKKYIDPGINSDFWRRVNPQL